LSSEVEVKIEPKQMLVHVAGDSTNCLLCNRCENGIAEFLEYARTDSRYTICVSDELVTGHDRLIHGRLTCNYHASCNSPSSTANGNKIDVHAINDRLKVERHLNV
jgi:hypothetical protein